MQVVHPGLNLGQLLDHLGTEILVDLQYLQLSFVDLQTSLVNSGPVISHLRPEHPQLALLIEQTLFVNEPLLEQVGQFNDFTAVGFLQMNLGTNHRFQSLDLLIQLANALA